MVQTTTNPLIKIRMKTFNLNFMSLIFLTAYSWLTVPVTLIGGLLFIIVQIATLKQNHVDRFFKGNWLKFIKSFFKKK